MAAGLLLVPVGLLGALAVEVGLAGRRTYATAGSAPLVRGDYGAGAASVLAVLGDSTAAGLGVTSGDAADTVGGQLATALAATGRRVALRGFGVSGARAADLDGQVDRLEALLAEQRAPAPAAPAPAAPLVAVVLVGSNDATHLTSLVPVGEALDHAVLRLRALGARVVVGTCPDMGSARAFDQPLRAVVGWRGRAVARVEAAAARAAGGEPVDLGALTGPQFRRDQATTSFDRFHPSVQGYGVWARALLPAVVRAAQ